MAPLIVLPLLIVVDVVAWLWGNDSRDGRDWMARTKWARRPAASGGARDG